MIRETVLGALSVSESKDNWYLMRGSGMVALVLFTLTLIAGIAGVRRWSTEGCPRSVVTFLHRNIALLAVVFLAIHIVSAEFDTYVPIGWLASLVPFVSGWKSLWVGLGALSVDIMIALVITSLIRTHLSHRLWRSIHWAAYACWPLAVLHGFKSGTDSSAGWARVVYIVSIVLVAAAVVWRIAGKPAAPPATAFRMAPVDPRKRPSTTRMPAKTPAVTSPRSKART